MIRSNLSLVAAALLAVSLAACGSDSSPTGTPTDTTPPGVESVTPVDAYHIDIAFTEKVTKSSAENEANYTIVSTGPTPVAPRGNNAAGGGLLIAGATLKNDDKTVTVATETSMSGFDFSVTAHGVSDMTGNKIGSSGVSKPFSGSNTTDSTAPTLVSHTPLSGAANIAVNATVTATFSEAIENGTATWTYDGGTIPFTSAHDGATLTLTPDAPLPYNTTFTVMVAGTDFAANAGTNTSWSFTTQANNDRTPPTLVSTSPANLATNVNEAANLSITFSEAINQTESNVVLVPDPGDGVATWSNGGKTITFDPTNFLQPNTQYTLTIFPNGVKDLAGNGIVGLHTVQFTTGAYLASGAIAGTITGDAGTPAADPTGATVIASNSNPFNGPNFSVFQSTKVTAGNTYDLIYLPNGLFYIVCVMDTNHDGDLDPSTGDAVGGYGVTFPNDLDPDSVAVDGGAHVSGKNFTLYDPSTASGTVQYTGSVKGTYPILVGLFATSGFSPTDVPVAGTEAFDVDNQWSFNSIDGSIPEGTYYVGAFMDVNNDGSYQPASEPAGFYGGLPAPTALTMANGHDNIGVVIHITDPAAAVAGAPAAAMIWPKAKHNAAFQHMVEVVRQSQMQARN
jgi:methionine-rich copper-binding protein CopC